MNPLHPAYSPALTRGLSPPDPHGELLPVGRGHIGEAPNAEGFVAMLGDFRRSGGIERAADVAWLLDEQPGAVHGRLTSLLGSGVIFGFTWRDTLWVPMFQFDPRDMSVRTRAQQVRLALGAEFDPWSLSTWFAQSNEHLTYQRPVDLIDMNLPAVLHAAHADRRLWRRN